MELPRTPVVFEEKVKRLPEQAPDSGWSFEEDSFVGAHCQNYSSAKDFAEEVRSTLEDQVTRNQIQKMAEQDAVAKFGDRLTIASLGAIEKGTRDDGSTEIRIIHDGTHRVDVNRYIRVRDRIPFPVGADVSRLLRHQASTRTPFFGLTADVKEAHRAVAVHPDDWPLQACQVETGGSVYLNKRGTYGISSAAYWWGRLAAALHRGLVYGWSNDVEAYAFLFADDWWFTAAGKGFAETLLGAILYLRTFGVPLSWKKVTGGFVVAWIGYEIDLRNYTLGITERRAEWLIGWLSRTLADNRVLMRELRQALGRMVFIYGALPWDKPFLAPLFAFLSHGGPGACMELPLFVRTTLSWLLDRVQRRRAHPCGIARRHRGSVLRVDAKAEGSAIGIGGWMPHQGPDGEVSVERSRF